MELGAAGLKEQPFRTHGRPVVFVPYSAQHHASNFLEETSEHNAGLALFQGPSLSGKTTILQEFVREHKSSRAVAIVNGSGLGTKALLEESLKSFGYEHQFDTVNEMLGMLTVFIRQQTMTALAPVLIIEDIHEMNPNAMRVLCELAEVRIREKFALKLVLASDRSIDYLAQAPAMECISKRLTGSFHLDPLLIDETVHYIMTKLRHGGCIEPENVFNAALCEEIHRASGGWPGIIDRLALLALAKAKRCPIALGFVEHPAIPASTRPNSDTPLTGEGRESEVPVLRLTHNGKLLKKIKLDGSRLLIGRSEHNDVTIDSKFVSRHHTLLVRNGSSILLMDLNSVNGTYVNSWRVSNQVLQHNDVITIGEHGLKLSFAAARNRSLLDGTSFDDTLVMKSLDDMRRVLARENTAILPASDIQPEPNSDSA